MSLRLISYRTILNEQSAPTPAPIFRYRRYRIMSEVISQPAPQTPIKQPMPPKKKKVASEDATQKIYRGNGCLAEKMMV